PVQAHARVRIDTGVRAVERLAYDVGCALVVAVVGERVAEERRVPDLSGDVLAYLFDHASEAALEEPDCAVGRAEGGVRLTKGGVDIWAMLRRWGRVLCDGRLEALDRFEMAATLCRGQAEGDAGADRRADIPRGCGLREDLLQLEFRVSQVVAQAELEL